MYMDEDELYASLTPEQAKWLTHFGRVLTTGSATTTDSDLSAPNFPFPPGYTKIDFDHLNAANFVHLADGIAAFRRTNQEPFLQHSRKMKEFEDLFDANDDRFRLMLEPRKGPLVTVRRDASGRRNVSFYNRTFAAVQQALSRQTRTEMEDYAIARRKRIIRDAQTTAVRAKELRLALLDEKKRPENAWLKGASVTRFNFDEPPPTPPEEYVPDMATVERVQKWLEKNFDVKPVPLLLHIPQKIKQKMAGQLKPPPLVMDRLPFQPEPVSHMSLLEEPIPIPRAAPSQPLRKSKHRRGLHIIRGLIVSPDVVHGHQENSFIPGYELNPRKELMMVLHGPSSPHRFRHVMPLSEFLDNEIVFQIEGNLLLATARSPGRIDRNPRLVEEVVEIPDGVPLLNLKFYRSMDNDIVIEEVAFRPLKKRNLINLKAGQKSFPKITVKPVTASELVMGNGVIGYWPSVSSLPPDLVPSRKKVLQNPFY